MITSYECFSSSGNRASTKWDSYFEIYDRYLSLYRHKAATLFEIGVCDGGSLDMWRKFLETSSRIVGLDIDPRCKEFAYPDNTFVEICDQSDNNGLKQLIKNHGVPDIVIDDGSHTCQDILSTLKFFIPLMPPGGVYIIEDLHGTFWGDTQIPQSNNVFQALNQLLVQPLNAPGSRGVLQLRSDNLKLYSVSFYWSVVVIEFKEPPQSYNALKSQNQTVTKYSAINPLSNV